MTSSRHSPIQPAGGLLDVLHQRDGQTLNALEEGQSMTRFGVMKHLRVLEQAGLVVTRRQSYRALWSEDAKAEGTSRVTWEIEKVGDSCRLCITHDQLREGAPPELYGGWPIVLSGLKTLLETGQFLTTPGSLRHLGK